jgi:hypothetical protein
VTRFTLPDGRVVAVFDDRDWGTVTRGKWDIAVLPREPRAEREHLWVKHRVRPRTTNKRICVDGPVRDVTTLDALRASFENGGLVLQGDPEAVKNAAFELDTIAAVFGLQVRPRPVLWSGTPEFDDAHVLDAVETAERSRATHRRVPTHVLGILLAAARKSVNP